MCKNYIKRRGKGGLSTSYSHLLIKQSSSQFGVFRRCKRSRISPRLRARSAKVHDTAILRFYAQRLICKRLTFVAFCDTIFQNLFILR